MSRKYMNKDKTHLALRCLMYLRIGLYNALWSVSQSSVIYGSGNIPQVSPDASDPHDTDGTE